MDDFDKRMIRDHVQGLRWAASDASAHNDKRRAENIRYAADEIEFLLAYLSGVTKDIGP